MLSPASSHPDTSRPLSPYTFAGMVEEGLKQRFDEKDIERVLISLCLLDQEYYRKEFVGSDAAVDSEDLVQECHSYSPRISVKPFWNPEVYEWAKYLESHHNEIRKELDAVTKKMVKLKQDGNNIWAGAFTEHGPSEIKKHNDFTNCVLTSHLALDIPFPGENKCWLTVGGESKQWINRNVYVFDTSLLHDAVNESDQKRFIPMLRL